MNQHSKTAEIVAAGMTYVLKYPLMAILLSSIVCAIFLAGVPRFEISSSTRAYLGEDQPRVKTLVQLEQEYIEDLNVFIMLVPEQGSVFSQSVLEAAHYLTETAWQVPYVRRVDSITNFQYTDVEGDDLIVEDLVLDPDLLNDELLQNIQQIALSEPRLKDFLVAENGRATAVNMLLDVDTNDIVSLREVGTEIRRIEQYLAKQYPHIKTYAAGYVYMLDSYNLSAERDLIYIYAASILIMLTGLAVFFRNIRAALAVLLIGVLPTLMGLGLIGFLGGVLNAGTVLCTLMVLILGLADGIHITKSVRRLLGEGLSKAEAIKQAVVSNFTPVILTSVTTAIGFLTFNLSGYAGIGLMGNYVAFGVMMAFLLSITLLPAMLYFCELKPEIQEKSSFYDKVAGLVIKYHKWLLILALPSAISIYLVTTIEFDERVTRYLRGDQPFTISLDAIQENLTGATTMLYNFNSGESGGVSDPVFMSKVDNFTTWLRQQPEVRHVSSYTDTVKTLNQNLHEGDPSYYRLPENQSEAAQYLLLYEMSLPYGLDLTNQINLDKSGTRMVIATNDLSITQANSLIARNTAWLEQHAPSFDTFANSDSLTLLFSAGDGALTMLISGAIALIIIGVMLLFTFRSFNVGVLCVVAVISPILVAFGLWSILVGRVGMSGTMSFCMVIGISVDFSVHFISKYVYARRQLKFPNQQSVQYAFKLVAAPILTSVVVLGGGFGMLTFSLFEYSNVMGAITAISIVLAALYSLFFVPAILLSGKIVVK